MHYQSGHYLATMLGWCQGIDKVLYFFFAKLHPHQYVSFRDSFVFLFSQIYFLKTIFFSQKRPCLTNFASSTFLFGRKTKILPNTLISFYINIFEIFSAILKYLPYYACTKFHNSTGHDLQILSLCHMEDLQSMLYASFNVS